MIQTEDRYMLKSIAGWLAINAFFVAFLLIFAGIVYALMSFSRWITAGMIIEIQYFSGLLFGLAAVAITIWLMHKFHAWITRRRS